MRTLLAAIVGGILVFAWGAFSHLKLMLTDTAFEKVPNETAFLEAVEKDTEPGFYAFPWFDHKNATEEETKAWQEKTKTSPVGILIRNPKDPAGCVMSPVQLGIELASNILGAWILALVVAAIGRNQGYATKVLLCGLLGLFCWVSQNVSYWNWYHFSVNFTKGELLDAVASWTLAGIAIAAIVRPKAP